MISTLGAISIGFAAIATGIIVWFLVARPAPEPRVKLILLAGIGALPIAAAVSGNVAGYQVSQKRQFCSSCHVMVPYTADSNNVKSETLASMHARNEAFGDGNCYACHSDYAMFGTVTTKLSGLLHLYRYYAEYRDTSLEDARDRIKLYKPYVNQSCMHCHSTNLPGWRAQRDHAGALEEVRSGKTSCVGSGCHGPSHPFSKPPEGAPAP